MARRGRLPGLRPQLRRRERRRDRRPRRRPRSAAVPARPRRRRALVQPVVPVAARRRRLRHRRLPLDRPGLRDARRGRAADRRGARARHPHDRRHRPEPRLEPAPLVPRGPRARRPARRSASASGSGPGTGANGELPPNGWQSIFGGSAWTRTTTDGDGEWYLHLFAPEQPDLNWTHPDVCAEHEDILRFWFDRGVAGVRIDSAALLVKDPSSPRSAGRAPGEHPFTDRDELHEIYRRWRAIADGYAEPRVLVGEVWLPDAERFARYLRPDELHTAFNFDFLACPWEPGPMRASIESALAAHAPVDAPATWVLSNHDVTRPVTRYGRADTSFAFESKRAGTPTDLERGTRRARAAALLAMALPGSMYIYQGEELGLPEVEDIPAERRQDPMWHRSGGVDPVVTAAGSRCRGRATGRPTGSAPTEPRGPGSTSRTTGRRSPSPRSPTTRLDARPLPRRPAPAPRRPWARRRRAALASRRRRGARVRARRALRLPRQLRPGPGRAAGRRRRPHRQQRARRRCASAGHHGLAPPGERSSEPVDPTIHRSRSRKGKDDEVHSYGHDRRRRRGEPAGSVRRSVASAAAKSSADASRSRSASRR